MMSTDRLERELEVWLAEVAAPRRPDFTDDLLFDLATVAQRPRWTFPPRWIPIGDTIAVRWPRLQLGLVVVAGLLALLAIAAFVGGYRPLPPPFGPAANGLVAYEKGGDIFAVDPASGARHAISIEPARDHSPRWSSDGTRLAFLRATGGDLVMIAEADGTPIASTATPLRGVDPDSIAWSPDGRSVALSANASLTERGGREIVIVDATDGSMAALDVAYHELEIFWRPPDGRQLAFYGGDPLSPGIFLYSFDDGTVTPIPLPEPLEDARWRPAGFTSDGTQFVVHGERGDVPAGGTRVVDVATGAVQAYETAFGRLSHDERRIVGTMHGLNGNPLCVISIDGGRCEPISSPRESADLTRWTGLYWSPDDQWILLQPIDGGTALVLDADGETESQPDWIADGGEAWQRIAR